MARRRRASHRSRGRPFLESAALLLATLLVDALVLLLGMEHPAPAHRLALAHLGVLSVATFGTFGLDKWLARKGWRRVSEENLLLLSFLGGAPGGLLAMTTFHHKSRKLSFRILVPTAILLQTAVIAYLLL